MANWPTLSIQPDMRSQYGGAPKLITLSLGDGYEQRSQDGINHDLGNYKVSYEMLEDAEFNTLYTFLKANNGGQAVTVPNWVIDPTGATTAEFFIVDFRVTRATSPILADVEVLLREVVS